ncbi:MAG: T9SS type A sorting domain-containing protein [Gemmatimonadota bacterium]|nr:MAG: T9SS type A sorting domain-containing protein [Gemmatimonadota bacterium]
MRAQKSLPVELLYLLVVGLFLLSLPISSWSLDVVSIEPADGATGVDTSVTMRFEFDAPVDTTVRFEFPEDFFLSMFFNEDLMGDPDSIVVSQDLRTVELYNPHLKPDTRYVFGLIGAFSTTGEPLDKPVAFTFTTGDALPTGTVSGTLSSDLGNPTDALVVLFDKLFDEKPEALVVVSSVDGIYTLNYVPGDTFFVAAAKDIDQDGEILAHQGIDIFAVYDPDNDGFPDPRITSESGETTGVDMVLMTWMAITARQRYDDVLIEAVNWSPDAYLVLAASEVTPAGEGYIWNFQFYSPSKEEYYSIAASSEIVWEWAILDDDDDGLPQDSVALPSDWIDSDVAADTAEAHGGAQFRADHPDAQTVAVLANADLFGGDKRMTGYHTVSDSNEVSVLWIYVYQSEEVEEDFMIPLDALTGEFIEIQQPVPSTARFTLDVVTDAAADWSSDAELVFVGTHQSSITPTGKAMTWFYIYFSPAKDSVRAFIGSNGILFHQGDIWEPPSRVSLPEGWVDSDVVMATVEAAGGADYRAENDSVAVEGGVTRNFNPFIPDDAAWKIRYTSTTSDPMDFYVDALTGQYMTDIEPESWESEPLPVSCNLSQNYPNPFNPSTDIRYQIADDRSSVQTTLKVYNILGQEVRTLVNKAQEPSYFTVSWNGRDENGLEVSSGIYFFRLTAGPFTDSKRMVLLR